MEFLASARQELIAGNQAGCEMFCKSELAANPTSAEALELLSDLYFQNARYLEARVALVRLLALPGKLVERGRLDDLLGLCCVALGDGKAGKTAFEQALHEDALDFVALYNLAVFAHYEGDRKLVADYANQLPAALEKAPLETLKKFPDIAAKCASLLADHVPDTDIANARNVLETITAEGRASFLRSRPEIGFALGKLYQREGKFRDSLEWYRQGNQTRRKVAAFSIEPVLAAGAEMRALFDEEYLKDTPCAEVGDDEPHPIFIVGMPRTGTTLVEQILAAHSSVQAYGERDTLPRLLDDSPDLEPGLMEFAESAKQLQKGFFQRLREEYLQSIELDEGQTYFTDKLPSNLRRVWAIALAFPDARVIAMQRDEFPTIMSCFTNNFLLGNEFSNHLSDCLRYYRDCDELRCHWARVLADRLLTVRYELLVENEREEISRVLSFLDLVPEDACFKPHELQRTVLTASSAQVQEPIHRRGNTEWEPYRSLLGEELHLVD